MGDDEDDDNGCEHEFFFDTCNACRRSSSSSSINCDDRRCVVGVGVVTVAATVVTPFLFVFLMVLKIVGRTMMMITMIRFPAMTQV